MPPIYIHYLLIPHPTEPQILLLADEVGHAMPRYEMTEPHYWQTVAPVNQLTDQHLSLKLTTLRCIETIFGDEQITMFYAMDGTSIPFDWTLPEGAIWAGQFHSIRRNPKSRRRKARRRRDRPVLRPGKEPRDDERKQQRPEKIMPVSEVVA